MGKIVRANSAATFADGFERLYDCDARHLVEDYYALVGQVARAPDVSIIGHIFAAHELHTRCHADAGGIWAAAVQTPPPSE